MELPTPTGKLPPTTAPCGAARVSEWKFSGVRSGSDKMSVDGTAYSDG
jgi:hypothetical protein